MAVCTYCGRNAGLMKKFHVECKTKYDSTWQEMQSLTVQTFRGQGDLQGLEGRLVALASEGGIESEHVRGTLVNGWTESLERYLGDNILSEREQDVLVKLAGLYQLSREELDADGSYSKMLKGAVLRNIIEGRLPQHQFSAGELPFNLLKTETLVWVFTNCTCYEEKTVRTYVGKQQGVSVRVAKGVYYRSSSFRGHPVETSHLQHIDVGNLGITDKHVYFAGPRKAFRVPYSKIVGFTPYTDGLGIGKDAPGPKTYVFSTGDGWFSYNLVTNLAHIGD